MKFRPGNRSQAKPLIGIYSESGCGKTYSALLLARGFVGPKGRIGMIETESGRGEAYADPAEYPEIGGYDVLSLHDDFSPKVYGQAIKAAEGAKLDALIIDSASHEWEGTGGVLAMAALNQQAGKKGPLVWQIPKIDHQREFMLRFMQSPIPLVILCMRAKYPMKEVKKPSGGKEWVRSETLEPKQSDDILFEMFVHGWVDGEHRFHMTKCTSKALEPVFGRLAPITLETGRQLAAWARGTAKEHAAGPPGATGDRKAAEPQPPSPGQQSAQRHAEHAAEAGPVPSGEAPSAPSPPPPSVEQQPPQRAGTNCLDETELLEEGRTKAAWGTTELENWWLQELTPVQQRLLMVDKRCPRELKEIAAEADRRIASG